MYTFWIEESRIRTSSRWAATCAPMSRVVKILSADWERVYHHPVYFIETFVNAPQYKGTCYRAANWVYLGKTTGRGKADQTHKPNRPIKQVLGYPLVKQFREKLCGVEP